MIENEQHPWTGSHEEFMRDVLPQLREHGKTIGRHAESGDVIAKEIMDRYASLYRSFDPMTAILVKLSLEKWLQSHGDKQ